MNVRSNSSLTSSEIFASTGSAAVRAGPPARSSSQFADQETFMSFPLRRRGDQVLVVVGPRLVVVADRGHERVGEDVEQLGDPAAGPERQPAAPVQRPAAPPAVLVLVGARVPLARPGLDVVEPGVLDAAPVRPRLLAGDR